MKNLPVILAALCLGACAATPDTAGTGTCRFPAPDNNSPEPAPGWLCSRPQPGLALQAWGVAAPSTSGASFMQEVAVNRAQQQLAQSFAKHVDGLIEETLESAQTAGATVDRSQYQSVKKAVYSMQLVDTRLVETMTGPGGSLYALVGLDQAAYVRNRDLLFNRNIDPAHPEVYVLFQQQEAKKDLENSRQR